MNFEDGDSRYFMLEMLEVYLAFWTELFSLNVSQLRPTTIERVSLYEGSSRRKQVNTLRTIDLTPSIARFNCILCCFQSLITTGILRNALESRNPISEAPPPDPYTVGDMLRFLPSFSSDHDAWTMENLNHEEINRKILSDMDGGLRRIRLDYEDINNLIRKWGLDIGYTMDGTGF